MDKKTRSDFPLLQAHINGHPLIYLDTAATAQKPRCVINAMQEFYATSYGTVHRGIYSLSKVATDKYFEARQKIQHFINAACPEEIIFTRGTTAALNLVAASFGKAFIKKNDVVLISEIEHHSNIVPWQMMCEERGAKLEIIPVDDNGDIILEAFEKLLLQNVKMVSIAHISNAVGSIHPLTEIIRRAHAKGAFVCIDGAQGACHGSLDVQELDCDFYAFSGHKLYGPTGIGVLYGKKELLEKMPPIEGGGDMIERVSLQKTTYGALPLKFEAGTPPIAEVLGLGAAIDYLQKIGLKKISEWEEELVSYALKKLEAFPNVSILGNPKKRGPLITFNVDEFHPLDLGTFLDGKGVAVRTGHLCSQPTMARFKIESAVRISFGLYNTKEEIDAFIKALEEVVLFLRSVK